MPLLHPASSTSSSPSTISSPAFPQSHKTTALKERSPSPPAFSPITPKAQPVLPAIVSTQDTATVPSVAIVDPEPAAADRSDDGESETVEKPALPSTHFVPEPPSKPFSSAESTDGLALKAAISSLQFQKQKAQDDIKSLDKLRQLALAEPERFAQELAAGRVKEQRHQFGDMQDVFDSTQDQTTAASQASSTHAEEATPSSESERLPGIPGPQNVVRMPHINWEKYHILGEPLDALHEQQRRWPGSTPFQQNPSRDFAVAAPYSPFHDAAAQQNHSRNASDSSRKDSIATGSVVATPVVAEHPYETRKSSKPHGT